MSPSPEGSVPEQEDEWRYTTEHIAPHGLCCAECKAALARVERLEGLVDRAMHLLNTARIYPDLEDQFELWLQDARAALQEKDNG